MSVEKYRRYKLRDLCVKIGSGATPTGGKEAYLSQGEISLIRSQNVLDFSFTNDGLAFINEEQARKLNNVQVQEGDVLLNITGDSVARVCQAPTSVLPARVNQHVAIIRADNHQLLNDYLKYYLLNPKYKEFMLGLSSVGGTRNALTKGMIEDFDIELPDLATQQRIAAILSAFDDKIALNRQMNQTLEDMARAVFREWFVNFNYPGANGVLEDGLPEGWRMEKLGNLLKIYGGTTPSTANKDFWDGEYSWATPKDLSNLQSLVLLTTGRKITEAGVRQIGSGVLPAGTLLLSSRAPIGYLAISTVPILINQDFIAINGIDVSNLFMMFWLKENMETVISRANGSTFLEISKSNFKEINIVVPANEVLEQFEVLVKSLIDQITLIEIQSQTLAQLRDNLLPKMMKGEIAVRSLVESDSLLPI